MGGEQGHSSAPEQPAPLVAVILAGGSGTRFWPLSTPQEPKQFLTIAGQETMLQSTWRRLDGLVPPERRLVITGQQHVQQSAAGLEGLDPRNLIGEPERRDTAAAAILGTALASRRWPGATVLTLPADHVIEPTEQFQQLVREAATVARREQSLCTIGIPPLYPAEGYGYIERSEPLPAGDGLRVYRVRRFVEKPNSRRANGYLQKGNFYWNAGIFLWPADVLLDEARQFLPEHERQLSALADAWGRADFQQQMSAAYAAIESISVDVGIMERTGRATVVEANFKWSDLGGWTALGERLQSDGGRNHVLGQVMLNDCHDSIVYNTDQGRPLVCIGVEGLVVVHTAHGTLVCPKNRVESIKQAVNQLYA